MRCPTCDSHGDLRYGCTTCGDPLEAPFVDDEEQTQEEEEEMKESRGESLVRLHRIRLLASLRVLDAGINIMTPQDEFSIRMDQQLNKVEELNKKMKK